MSYRILVVDDTNFMRKMVTDCLKQAGHTVVGEATNGREAIRLYEELRPEIVMMDLTMPEMNGIDALKEILKIDAEAVVLICSASNQQDMIFDALDVGAKGYLMKPFNPERVTEIIRKYAEPHLLKQDTNQAKPLEDLLEDLPASKPEASPEENKTEQHDEASKEESKEEPNKAADVKVSLHPFEPRIVVQDEPEKPEEAKGETSLQPEDTGKPISATVKLPEAAEEQIAAAAEQPRVSPVVPSAIFTKPVNPIGENPRMRKLVSSLLCNWQDEVQGEVKNYNVICTQSENNILIEMTGAGDEKQSIQFTLDGFRDLAAWFEQQLGTKTA